MWTALGISLLTAWFVLYALVLSGIQQHRDNAVLYSRLREGLSGATTPIGGDIASSTPIAAMTFPALGMTNGVIVEGTGPRDLAHGVGHRRDTPLPGQPGVSILYGRSLTFGAPFKGLAGVRRGARISVTTGEGSFTYLVEGVRHIGDPLPAPLAAGGSRLLLESSAGSALAPTAPVLLDAVLSGKSLPSAGTPQVTLPPPEQAFGTDTGVLPSLVFWLQGLVLALSATVWAALRWGRGQAWLVGLPLIVATLWGVSSTLMMLLPNLI